MEKERKLSLNFFFGAVSDLVLHFRNCSRKLKYINLGYHRIIEYM